MCCCGPSNEVFKLPGPDGSWYAINLQRPMPEADIPAGVIISKHDSLQALTDVEGDELPDLPMPPHTNGWPEAVIVTSYDENGFVAAQKDNTGETVTDELLQEMCGAAARTPSLVGEAKNAPTSAAQR